MSEPSTSNPQSRYLVTGATGSLGRFVVADLVRRGLPVRILVRPTSDPDTIANLRSDGGDIELYTGDLSDPQSLSGLMTGVSHVIHCAVRLGDWGPWEQFEQGIVATTRHLINCCLESSIERFVHVGSVASYGHIRDDGPWNETQPLGQNLWWWDYYARAKMLAEAEATRLGSRTTIVRPTWIYGPGDQTILPRILSTLQQGKVTLLGDSKNLLNLVHASDVARSTVQAAISPKCGGQTFNLCSDGQITQREFFDLLAERMGYPKVKKSAPVWLAHQFGFVSECIGHSMHRSRPPRVTRHGISLLTRPTCFSSEKATRMIGWEANQPIRERLIEALDSIAELSRS